VRIRVIWEGKTKDIHLRALQGDYQRRIAHFAELVVEEIHPFPNLSRRSGGSSADDRRKGSESGLTNAERRLLERLQDSFKIFLDSSGREWTSGEFAEWLGRQALQSRRELAFLVGGTEGFSDLFRKHADLLLSLSRMTLTRDWARSLLLEQLYRSFTILRGYPYPR